MCEKIKFVEFAEYNLSEEKINLAVINDEYGKLEIPRALTIEEWEKWCNQYLGTDF